MVLAAIMQTGTAWTDSRHRARAAFAARRARRAAKREENELLWAAVRDETSKWLSSRPQAKSDVRDALVAATVALKGALAAVQAALAIPAWTSDGEQVFTHPGETSTPQSFLQELFDNWNAEKAKATAAEGRSLRLFFGYTPGRFIPSIWP